MAPKTERIELRLEPEIIERLDEWRMAQWDLPTRSEAIRRLLDDKLEEHTKEGFRLNNTDKLTIWMLSEVLKNQIKDRADQREAQYDMKTVNLVQEAIYGGHFWALLWEMTGVMHDHVDDPKKVRSVVDILDMWNFIERAYAGYSDAEKAEVEAAVGIWGKDPKFHGFDGNNETEYMGIARFLVDQLGRFTDFKGRDFNSHSPTVARHMRMARRFDDIRRNLVGREMSPGEMIEVLKLEASRD